MKIKDVMSRDLTLCHGGDSMKVAAELMWKADVGCLPVVDVSGVLIGMVTDRDLLMSTAIQGRPLDELAIDSAMAREVRSLSPGDPIERALELMSTWQVRRVPVLDADRRPVGLVSLSDLARRADRDRRPKPADLVHALAKVCEPRAHTQACVGPQGQVATTS